MENLHKLSILSLTGLGIDERSAEIYLGALTIGGGSVLDIARASDIERTGIYYHISQLLDLGLLKEGIRGKKRIYIPVDPTRLRTLLKEKQQNLNAVLPHLQEAFAYSTHKPSVAFFQGHDGILELYGHIESILKVMNQNEKAYVFSRTFDAVAAFPTFFPEYFKRRDLMAVKSFTILPTSEKPNRKSLASTDPIIQAKFSFHSKNRKYIEDKHFPEGAGSVVIFRNYVAMVDFKTYFGSLTESKNLAATWKSFFEFIWDHLPEIK